MSKDSNGLKVHTYRPQNSRDGTRVEPEPEKPGFMYEIWNPGFKIQTQETRVLEF